MIRFALIADSHIGPEKPYEGQIRKLSRNSVPYLRQLAGEIAGVTKPDFIVQLGDLIEDSASWSEDYSNFASGIGLFDRMPAPTLSVIGNHDQVKLSVDELARLNKMERLYFSRDIAGLHCVVLFSSSKDHTDIHISSEQQEWLRSDLEATDKPAFIFLHHPLDDQSLQGNVWFEKYPDYCFVEEKRAVRDILESSGKVQAVFNGHVHQNAHSVIGGIHYFTIQSLVEKQGEPDVCSRSYALVTVEGRKLTVEVCGRDAAYYRESLKETEKNCSK